MIKRSTIIPTARTYCGVKWEHQGRNKDVGIDCIGLPVLVARDLGLEVRDVQGYGRTSEGRQLIKELDKSLVRLKPMGRKDGSVLVFQDALMPMHVAFYYLRKMEGRLEPYIIHSQMGFFGRDGKVVDVPLTDDMKVIAEYDLPGVED